MDTTSIDRRLESPPLHLAILGFFACMDLHDVNKKKNIYGRIAEKNAIIIREKTIDFSHWKQINLDPIFTHCIHQLAIY